MKVAATNAAIIRSRIRCLVDVIVLTIVGKHLHQGHIWTDFTFFQEHVQCYIMLLKI
jgi:hypothetical protein